MKRPSSSLLRSALAAALLAASPAASADPPPVAPPAIAPPAAAPAPPPARAPAPPAAMPAPPAAPAPAGAAWTRVRIVTQGPKVALERRQGSLPTDQPLPPLGVYAGEPTWDAVCTSPCDAAVQLGGEYRISGEGVTTSSGFALHGPTTDLLVDAGSYSMRRAGVWLIVVGGIAAVAGAIFLGVDAVPKNGQASADILNTGGIASIAALAGGGALTITGIGLVIGGGTTVRDESRRELARGPLSPAAGMSPAPTVHATFAF